MFVPYIVLTFFLVQSCRADDLFIANAHDAPAHQYPYQVVIYAKSKVPIIGVDYPICGGVILESKWILTSAQCLRKHRTLFVKAGKQNLTIIEHGQEERFVKLQIVHNKYKAPGIFHKIAENDIALLKLSKGLTFNDHVQPLALPKSEKKHNGVGFLTGWGGVHNWNPSNVLQSVKVPFIDSLSCTEIINSFYKVTIYKEQICTGTTAESVSACGDDLGGPVVQFQGDGTPELVGIVTWFDTPCSTKDLPTVYTRVSSYVEWINEKMRTVRDV